GAGAGARTGDWTALERATGMPIELEDLTIRAATPGRDAVGEVSIRARIEGKPFTGRGASTDVVDAAARAYLHALNKAAQARELEAKALEEASYLWGV